MDIAIALLALIVMNGIISVPLIILIYLSFKKFQKEKIVFNSREASHLQSGFESVFINIFVPDKRTELIGIKAKMMCLLLIIIWTLLLIGWQYLFFSEISKGI